MTIVRVIDFETTGAEPPEAEVCEVGFCDVRVDNREVGKPQSWLCSVRAMPPDVRAVHHISMADCVGQPAFNQEDMLPEEVRYLAAHNVEFEAKFLNTTLPMICTYKSALRVWPGAPNHKNNTLRYWLEDQGKISPNHAETLPSHRAGPDAYVTAHIFLALLNEGATGREMVRWTREPPLLPTCPLGKFRGRPWSEVEAGFLGWMLRQPEMDAGLKWNAQQEIARRGEAA